MQAPQRRRRNDAMLIVLLSDVTRARSAFRAGRLAPGAATSRPEQALRAARLASAMESYADAAVSTGVPLPYRYRDELRLYQAIAGAAVIRSEVRQLVDPQGRPPGEVAHGRDQSRREVARRREPRAEHVAAPPDSLLSNAELRRQEAASARDFERRNLSRVMRPGSSDQTSTA
jgi:hypothetical protein